MFELLTLSLDVCLNINVGLFVESLAVFRWKRRNSVLGF